MLGIGLGYSRRSRSLGGRAAQHVEADPAGGSMVPRRQSASVAALFAVPRAATESADGGAFDAGLRLADRSSRELTCFAGAVAAPVPLGQTLANRGALRRPRSASAATSTRAGYGSADAVAVANRVYSGSGYAFGFSRNAVKAAFASGERSARQNSPSSASMCA